MESNVKRRNKRINGVYTTSQAAKVCRCSQQTIIRCFDNGSLGGHRVPGSRFRRIPREMLYKFMKDYGLPLEWLDENPTNPMIQNK